MTTQMYTWEWTKAHSSAGGMTRYYESAEPIEPPLLITLIDRLKPLQFLLPDHANRVRVLKITIDGEPDKYGVTGRAIFRRAGVRIRFEFSCSHYATPEEAINNALIITYAQVNYAVPMNGELKRRKIKSGQTRLVEKIARAAVSKFANIFDQISEIACSLNPAEYSHWAKLEKLIIFKVSRKGKYGRYGESTAESQFLIEELRKAPVKLPKKQKGICVICERSCVAAPVTENRLVRIDKACHEFCLFDKVMIQAGDLICRRHQWRLDRYGEIELGSFERESYYWLIDKPVPVWNVFAQSRLDR